MRLVSVCLNKQQLSEEQRRLSRSVSFAGKPLPCAATFGKQQSQWESVVRLAERETMHHAKYLASDEGYLDAGRKFVVTPVMQGALRI